MTLMMIMMMTTTMASDDVDEDDDDRQKSDHFAFEAVLANLRSAQHNCELSKKEMKEIARFNSKNWLRWSNSGFGMKGSTSSAIEPQSSSIS